MSGVDLAIKHLQSAAGLRLYTKLDSIWPLRQAFVVHGASRVSRAELSKKFRFGIIEMMISVAIQVVNFQISSSKVLTCIICVTTVSQRFSTVITLFRRALNEQYRPPKVDNLAAPKSANYASQT